MITKEKKRRKDKEEKTVSLAGIVLRTEAEGRKENRIYTLVLKGVLVYLFVMGGIGCFLSALDMEFSRFFVNITVFLIAIFCSVLYYNKYTMNIGYLVVMVLMVFGGSLFGRYINSGFYAVMNEITQAASDFFGTNVMRNYGEQVGNRYLAVTISTCYIGCVCAVLLNIMISRKMRHLLAFLLSIGILCIPLYLELEPDALYAAMLLCGLVSANILCGSGHFRLTQSNDSYQYLPEKKRISYVLCCRTMAGLMAAVFLFCFLLTQLMSVFYPKEQFKKNHPMSAIKESTMDTVENITLLGLMGLFNFYPNTGGMTNGTLGGVSSVRLDFETDLRIEFAPYCNERIYFKTFTGDIYLPYQNQWSRPADENGLPVTEQDDTFLLLQERYEKEEAYSAKGIMKITNVAAPAGVYLPYYSEDTNRLIYPGQTKESIYYPLLTGEMPDGFNGHAAKEWLYVPEQNREVIAAFCEEAGLSAENADALETARKLAAYYQEAIPYTLRPGMTPYRKDFINYFLSENRRGYCAHFASAATLIFRYLGIPARYVEGYAIDPADISSSGTLLEEARYEAYYDGYSLLGTEAVVSVEASDANAHAWVEVYDSELGWVAVDVTPASDEEEGGESLWQRLLNFLTGNQDAASEAVQEAAEEDGGGDGQAGRRAGFLIKAAVFLFIAAGAVYWSVREGRRRHRYKQADRNDKLIIQYQEYMRRLSRKHRELREKVNYEQQLLWLVSGNFWTADEKEIRECIRILEQAGFSRTEISERDFLRVMGHLKKYKNSGVCPAGDAERTNGG